MGLSRNKVAVPEGAAGTTPFWSLFLKQLDLSAAKVKMIKGTNPTSKKVRFDSVVTFRIVYPVVLIMSVLV